MGFRKWPWEREYRHEKEIGADDRPAYILETHSRRDVGRVEGELADYLPRGWSLSPVFPEAPDEIIADAFNLSGFWYLRLEGPPFRRWIESPYDLAYELMDRSPYLKSVEPDLPSGIFQPVGEVLSSLCEEPTSKEPPDRAWALRNIRAPEAWALLNSNDPTPGADISIGQPDTGVADHLELDGCVDRNRGRNFVEGGQDPTDPLRAPGNPGHGTATASVVASRGTVTPNGTGSPGLVTGSAPWSMVVPIRAIRSVVRITQGPVAEAVDHARHAGCHVISMSLGGLPLRALEAAILRAVHEQLIVVAAAGNCVRLVVWPARYQSVISLGGTNIDDKVWKGSSRGKRVDISAPAEFVWRAQRRKPTDPTTLVSGGQGTSFATALTAGVAALWLAGRRKELIGDLKPGWKLQDVFRQCLTQTARVPKVWDSSKFGAGIVNAENLLRSQCGPGSVAKTPRAGREPYAPQVDAVYGDVMEAVANTSDELISRISDLSNDDKEYFGHEALALLAQEAWLGASGSDGQRQLSKLEIPRLKVSERLKKKLRR